jgi:hypothetical protein
MLTTLETGQIYGTLPFTSFESLLTNPFGVPNCHGNAQGRGEEAAASPLAVLVFLPVVDGQFLPLIYARTS